MYYEPDTGYYEPTLAEEIFLEYKAKMSDALLASVKDEIDSLKNENIKLKEDNKEKNKKIIEISDKLKSIKNQNGFFEDIIKGITKETVEEFIKIIYKPDFTENAQFNDDAPTWFKLIVNYYSQKDKIISFLRYCGINVPQKADTFRLPFDWNKEEIDTFFDNMRNHYVCNSCIYGDNIGFWFREGYWDKPIDNCKHNYSEIPWQFILRNPILNTKEYCEKMADNINKGGNGAYFYKVCDYQDLSEDNLKVFINRISISKDKMDKDILNLLLKNINILDNDKYEKIYPYVKKIWQPIDYIVQLPKKYLIKYLHEDGVRAREIIPDLKMFTKVEKLELLKDFI